MATKDHEVSEDVVLSLCAGADLTKGQIVFSHDSKYFSCCAGWAVKVYNVSNGQCVQLLQGHRDLVTGLAINAANKLQLFSCGVDGVINRWIYLEGVLLRTYSFYMPLYALVSVDPSGKSVSAIVHRPQTPNCCLLRLPLSKDRQLSTAQRDGATITEAAAIKSGDIMLPNCDSDHRKMAHGCDGQIIVAVQGLEMWLYSCKTTSHRKLTTEANNTFTCVACHPTESCIATGHSSGKITIWWNVSHKDKTVTSTSHWHSLPVQCLAFSPEGSCLLSGGHECVLVRWQMNSEHKDFLPRLGAPLSSISPSPDGATFVTAHTDNVLQVITSSFTITHAMRGLARAHLGSSSSSSSSSAGRAVMPVGLLCDPRSGSMVTNGRPGHLQFYSMERDQQLYNLDIVAQNYVSPDNLLTPPSVTEVDCAAFDLRGDWLATFQRWEDKDGALMPEYCLKFWHYNNKKQNYQLNTTVETPHYKAVRCLRFKPGKSSEPVMVSTGEDGSFKLWTIVSQTHHGKSIRQWTCESAGFYRNKPATIARFSPNDDGKKLAVVFDNVLTIWDPDTNTMLNKVALDKQIRGMEVVGSSSGQLVVVTTESHLTALTMDSLSVHMEISLPSAILATDGELLCAVTDEHDVLVFRPDGSEPLLYKKKATTHPIISAAFLPRPSPHGGGHDDDDGGVAWMRGSRLYLLDSRQMLFTPTVGGIKAQTPQSRLKVELKQVLPQTPFQALLTSARQQQETDASTATSTAVKPLAGIDVMNLKIKTEGPFSTYSQLMLETMLVRRTGLEEPMEVEQGGEEVAMGDR